MDGRRFARFHVDIGVGDAIEPPLEILEGRDWLAFAGIPKPQFVAVSREQQWAEKFQTTASSPRGVRALKQYLFYARTGILYQADIGNDQPTNDFERAVGTILKENGYDVVPQVGVAGFFIDLGVRHLVKSGPSCWVSNATAQATIPVDLRGTATDFVKKSSKISAGRSTEYGPPIGSKAETAKQSGSCAAWKSCWSTTRRTANVRRPRIAINRYVSDWLTCAIQKS
jgi:hypothetical protein